MHMTVVLLDVSVVKTVQDMKISSKHQYVEAKRQKYPMLT